MKFYLSSYKLGDRTEELKELIAKVNNKTAFISNALDFSSDLERRQKSEESDIVDLEAMGLEVEKLDLRDYFGRSEELAEKLSDYGVIWVRGGNVFVLRQAMRLSGFEDIMNDLVNKKDLVYGAYSSGVCVLAPTLRGFDLVDDPNVFPYPEQSETIWEGLSVLDYSVVPHYASDHGESEEIDNVIKYMVDNKMLFKALRDGEVIIF